MPFYDAVHDLNPLQRAAVDGAGPKAIVGGGGTGKTSVLASHAIKLLVDGERPERVTVFTPYDQAAEDLRALLAEIGDPVWGIDLTREHRWDRQRLQAAVNLAPSVPVATMVQYACGVLRRAEDEGASLFSIWTEKQSLRVIRSLFGEVGGPSKPAERDVWAFYRWYAENMRRMPMELLIPPEVDYWRPLAALYAEEKRQCRALDLHDLVPEAVEHLERERNNNDAGNAVGNAVGAGAETRHVLVDHFHDITGPEFRLIDLLAGRLRSITIACDLAQRSREGSRADMLRWFFEYCRGAELHPLRLSYRASTQLAGAVSRVRHYQLAQEVEHYAPREVLSLNAGVREPGIYVIREKPENEVGQIIGMIRRGIDEEGFRPGDIAVIYPEGAHRVEWLATGLAGWSIPFQVDRSLLRIDRKGRGGPQPQVESPSCMPGSDAEGVLALLRCLSNPMDAFSFQDAAYAANGSDAKHPRLTDFRAIGRLSREAGIDLVEAARRCLQTVAVSTGLYRAFSPITDGLPIVARTLEQAEPYRLVDTVEAARELLAHARRRWTGRRLRDPKMERLLAHAMAFPHPAGTSPPRVLRAWLDQYSPALHPRTDPLEGYPAPRDRGGLAIMTTEAAAGMEWEWVLVIVDWTPPRTGRQGHLQVWQPGRSELAFLQTAASRAARRLDFIVSPLRTGGANEMSLQALVGILGDDVPRRAVGNHETDRRLRHRE